MYTTILETDLVTIRTSSLGDVVITRKADSADVCFQPGEAGSTMLDVLDDTPPDDALHAYIDEYFA